MTAPTVSWAVPVLPRVRLLPREEAHDFECWAGRLANTALLRDAVAVAIYRLPLLAVLVGAGRRGGQLHVLEKTFAEQTVQALTGRPGFPRLSSCGAVVEWSDSPPVHCDMRDRQGFCGLRDPAENAADKHQAWPPAGHRGYGPGAGRWPPPPSSPSGCRPPAAPYRSSPRRPSPNRAATASSRRGAVSAPSRYGAAPRRPPYEFGDDRSCPARTTFGSPPSSWP
ncbi:DUF6302 family protein [Streptomyces chromofuscus]|uniref:DUF6302 family protein n=1 Tax=Streptomyces chromofuscus TaxID=42881 RepID=UPI001D13D774